MISTIFLGPAVIQPSSFHDLASRAVHAASSKSNEPSRSVRSSVANRPAPKLPPRRHRTQLDGGVGPRLLLVHRRARHGPSPSWRDEKPHALVKIEAGDSAHGNRDPLVVPALRATVDGSSGKPLCSRLAPSRNPTGDKSSRSCPSRDGAPGESYQCPILRTIACRVSPDAEGACRPREHAPTCRSALRPRWRPSSFWRVVRRPSG